jgi:hypothetical protein
VIAAGQVGATDRTGKERVSNEQLTGRLAGPANGQADPPGAITRIEVTVPR